MERKIKYTILMAFAVVSLISGCKKDDDTNSTVTPSAKIKTITKLPTGTIETYIYDSLGRIAKITTTGTSTYQSFVYKGTDSIIQFSSNGTDSSRVNSAKLNGTGLVVASATPINTSTFTYDINGYQIYGTTNSIIGSAADTFVISGNNIAEHRSASSVPALNSYVSKQVYTFQSGKTNTVTNAAKGMSFLGKSNANVLNTEIFHSMNTAFVPPSVTTIDETYTYTYEYDSFGRVTKMTKTPASATPATAETYTYY